VDFVFFLSLLWQASSFIPNLAKTVQTFVIVYIVLILIGELTARTILQHAFSITNLAARYQWAMEQSA
jgi:hypothetical protein